MIHKLFSTVKCTVSIGTTLLFYNLITNCFIISNCKVLKSMPGHKLLLYYPKAEHRAQGEHVIYVINMSQYVISLIKEESPLHSNNSVTLNK